MHNVEPAQELRFGTVPVVGVHFQFGHLVLDQKELLGQDLDLADLGPAREDRTEALFEAHKPQFGVHQAYGVGDAVEEAGGVVLDQSAPRAEGLAQDLLFARAPGDGAF